MKRTRGKWFWPLLLGMSLSLFAQKPSRSNVDNVRIEIRQSAQPGGPGNGRGVFLGWDHNPLVNEYVVESSTDLQQWVPAGTFSAAALGGPDPDGRHTVEIETLSPGKKFYRMRGIPAPSPAAPQPPVP